MRSKLVEKPAEKPVSAGHKYLHGVQPGIRVQLKKHKSESTRAPNTFRI